jgi:hypothetical protein
MPTCKFLYYLPVQSIVYPREGGWLSRGIAAE